MKACPGAVPGLPGSLKIHQYIKVQWLQKVNGGLVENEALAFKVSVTFKVRKGSCLKAGQALFKEKR